MIARMDQLVRNERINVDLDESAWSALWWIGRIGGALPEFLAEIPGRRLPQLAAHLEAATARLSAEASWEVADKLSRRLSVREPAESLQRKANGLDERLQRRRAGAPQQGERRAVVPERPTDHDEVHYLEPPIRRQRLRLAVRL